jgi:hypothetical protein
MVGEKQLTLLSICQTCKYKGVDFLQFVRSGEKDIGWFAKKSGQRRGSESQLMAGPPSHDSEILQATIAGVVDVSEGFSHSPCSCLVREGALRISLVSGCCR